MKPTDQHHTNIADVKVWGDYWHPVRVGARWVELPIIPLIDVGVGLITTDAGLRPTVARCDYDEFGAWCAARGYSRPKRPTIFALHEKAARGEALEPYPVTLSYGPEMQTWHHSLTHDRLVWEALDRLGFDMTRPVPTANFCKLHQDGAPPGRCYLCGWWVSKLERFAALDEHGHPKPGSRSGPGFIQAGTDSGPGPHDSKQRDYASGMLPERDQGSTVGAFVDLGAALASTVAGGFGRALALDDLPDTERPAHDTPSHGARCSVAELYRDAVALGRWHSAEDVRAGRYQIKPGDLLISARGGQDPRTGGSGHVERAQALIDARAWWTIGGNEGDTWTRAPFDLQGATFLGVIEVPSSLGLPALGVALAELGRNVHEIPGPAASPRIQLYHACTRREGSPLAGMPGHALEGRPTLGDKASDEIPWCASGASWCQVEALRPVG